MMTSVDYINKKFSHIHLINCGACTGCFGRIATALYGADDKGMNRGVYMLIGSKAKPIKDNEVILCGNCAAPTFYNKLEGTFISGCPPSLEPLRDNLRKFKAKI